MNEFGVEKAQIMETLESHLMMMMLTISNNSHSSNEVV